MRRALRMAKRGRFTHPNPKVGAVLVQGNAIVGEGWHVRPGTPHAEAMAFAAAGEQARGATLYVTLEPCFHDFNRDGTPRISCTRRCLDAGIVRIVGAMEDPDTRTAGQGYARLRAAGIDVTVGTGEVQSRALNRPFIKHRTTGLPFVLHKAAMTLDGKIATASGSSRWITGAESRTFVHRALRNTVDAVIVGSGTVLADDPSLTTRFQGRNVHQPLRVLIDSGLRIPVSATVCGPGTLIYAVDTEIARRRVREISDTGAEVILLPSDSAGRVNCTEMLRHLANERGMLNVLLESGGELAASFYRERLVDTALFFVAPKLVGGRGAPTPIGGDGLTETMDGAVKTGTITMRRLGADVALCADIVYD